MITRLKGILSLDPSVFEEVEHDEKATGQAALIVIVSSLLAALGYSLDHLFQTTAPAQSPWLASLGTSSVLVVFLGIAIWSILAWLVWSAVTYFIGAKIFHGEGTFIGMLRVTGFAFAPLAFMILGVIPVIGLFISFLVIAWTLVAVFIGVRQGLELNLNKSLATVFVGWFIYAIGMGILLSIFGKF